MTPTFNTVMHNRLVTSLLSWRVSFNDIVRHLNTLPSTWTLLTAVVCFCLGLSVSLSIVCYYFIRMFLWA